MTHKSPSEYLFLHQLTWHLSETPQFVFFIPEDLCCGLAFMDRIALQLPLSIPRSSDAHQSLCKLRGVCGTVPWCSSTFWMSYTFTNSIKMSFSETKAFPLTMLGNRRNLMPFLLPFQSTTYSCLQRNKAKVLLHILSSCCQICGWQDTCVNWLQW